MEINRQSYGSDLRNTASESILIDFWNCHNIGESMDNATLLPLNQIVPNPDQPRKVRGNPSPTLMESIRRFGVLQPIVVRPLEDGRYM